MKLLILTAALVPMISAAFLRGADSPAQKICGVYTNVIEFDSPPRATPPSTRGLPFSATNKRAIAARDGAAS
jgi:hypothetical protein